MTGNREENHTVLVTGGAGYIGSHACKALLKAGYLPVAYDNLVYGHEWAAKWGPLERGDILDRSRLDEVIELYRPSAIMHFAAFAYVGESVADPGRYYRNNVFGSLNLLEAARDHGIQQFVFSSTCAIYGIPEQLPMIEDTPQRPINPYGASKLMVERMLSDFGAAHRFRSIALRYFNAAGADQEGEIGEAHDPETHLIPLVLDAVSGRRESVTIFGCDYDTPDGTCIRDYVHVSDLADAHVKALNALCSGSPSQVFNLGNGNGFSVRQVVQTVEGVTGLKVPVKLGERRSGDPAALVSDATKAKEVLGWQPQFVDLDDVVRTAWAWHQKSPSLAKANASSV
ncbi:MAG: UDP-glucose 4-epimerase GalE [Rhodomicrobium sp.]|jgi:UDP-arabinose 4-epimerase